MISYNVSLYFLSKFLLLNLKTCIRRATPSDLEIIVSIVNAAYNVQVGNQGLAFMKTHGRSVNRIALV